MDSFKLSKAFERIANIQIRGLYAGVKVKSTAETCYFPREQPVSSEQIKRQQVPGGCFIIFHPSIHSPILHSYIDNNTLWMQQECIKFPAIAMNDDCAIIALRTIMATLLIILFLQHFIIYFFHTTINTNIHSLLLLYNQSGSRDTVNQLTTNTACIGASIQIEAVFPRFGFIFYGSHQI